MVIIGSNRLCVKENRVQVLSNRVLIGSFSSHIPYILVPWQLTNDVNGYILQYTRYEGELCILREEGVILMLVLVRDEKAEISDGRRGVYASFSSWCAERDERNRAERCSRNLIVRSAGKRSGLPWRWDYGLAHLTLGSRGALFIGNNILRLSHFRAAKHFYSVCLKFI